MTDPEQPEIEQCGRCGSETVPAYIGDGQPLGGYCGDCHALTTSHGNLHVFEQDDGLRADGSGESSPLEDQREQVRELVKHQERLVNDGGTDPTGSDQREEMNIGELADDQLGHLTPIEELVRDLAEGREIWEYQIEEAVEHVEETQKDAVEILDRFEEQVGPVGGRPMTDGGADSTGSDRAPVVYDADGNALKVRLVGHECAGDVSGEGHYGYVDEENGAHRSLYFEEVDRDD